MADEDKEQRTQEATPKRREESREKGQFPKSREISSVTVMIGSLIVFSFYGTYMFSRFMNLTAQTFTSLTKVDLTVVAIHTIFIKSIFEFSIFVTPIFVVLFIVSLIAGIAQAGGVVLSAEKLVPQFSKINPIKGLGRLFSMQAVAELIKSIGKIAIVGYVAFGTINAEFANFPLLTGKSTGQILLYIGDISFTIFYKTVTVLAILAAIDYIFQRYEFSKSIKMTKQSIKQEYKETEGDPLIKSRVRSIQRERARRSMMKEVPKADVIITNPTRLSVAVSYDRQKMGAPRVVAKGAGFIAKRIREIGAEENIPIVENKPVAQMLFKTVKVGQEIPEKFYKAVAGILAYVFQLKTGGAGK